MRRLWARCLMYLPEDRANRYLVVTIGVSVLLHILVGLLLVIGGTLERRISKQGEPLLVDIAPDRPRESAPLGDPSRPVGPDAPAAPRQAAPPAPPAPKAAPPAPASQPSVAAPRPAPPAPRTADAPKAVAKASPAPEKSDEPGPPPKTPPAPPAPTPEQSQAAKATPQAPPQQLGAPPPRVASAPPESSATSGMFRRGGGGGLKGGRGGIEGEAIPLDTPDPKYQDYFNQIRERIKSKWIYPYEASSRGIGGELSIEFGIAKSGELQFIERRRSSGVEILDDYAMRAVQLASPFPPVPDAISKGGLPIHGIFRYQLLGSGLINNYLR